MTWTNVQTGGKLQVYRVLTFYAHCTLPDIIRCKSLSPALLALIID